MLNLNIDISTIDELFLPDDTEIISQIDGDLNIHWSEQKPLQANANFLLAPGYLKVSDDFNEHILSQWSQGKFAFDINEQQFSSELSLTDINSLPLVNINSNVDFMNENNINANIVLNEINLAPFQSIIAEIITLQGKMTAELAVGGTLNTPVVNGKLSLNEGKLRLRNNANTLDDIFSSITIENNQARFLHL